MKLFQSVQETFATLGITLNQSMKNNPFNTRTLAAFSSYILTVTLYTVFLFHDAKTFWEYTDNIYTNSATIVIVVCYVIIALNMEKCFALIDRCVTIVATSKLIPNVLSFHLKRKCF